MAATDLKPSASPKLLTDVDKVYLHDSVPELAVSKTLSKDTIPSGKMTYYEGSPVMRIEYKGRTSFMPITNIKCMIMKS